MEESGKEREAVEDSNKSGRKGRTGAIENRIECENSLGGEEEEELSGNTEKERRGAKGDLDGGEQDEKDDSTREEEDRALKKRLGDDMFRMFITKNARLFNQNEEWEECKKERDPMKKYMFL